MGAPQTGGQRAARDATLLARDTAKLESSIEALNSENLRLADKHREERARVGERQALLRTLGKRERELAKQLDFLATKLTEASQASSIANGIEAGGAPVDFRNLPG